MQEKIENLLNQMTLEEKVSMAAGSASWYTAGVERLNIPPLKVTDGPNGARGGKLHGGVSSACFPVGIALAATWNTDLVEQVGQALGEEAKTKGAHILLAPTVNIHRSPLNGRNFECYSEDPYLSARLAVAYINGVQSQGVGTSIKHYVCNDSEFERQSLSSDLSERTLREIYLPPFEAAVKEAAPWTVMAAYNKINGNFAAENTYTLIEILKEEWGFEGAVMSDWFGTKSTAAAANNGLDLEMPGPSIWRGERLLKAVQEGQVSESAIDDIARRMLRLMFKSGVLDQPEEQPEQALDKAEHRQVAYQAASEAIVLLKNEGEVLPLQTDKLKRVALIGPNAKTPQIQGGGSAQVKPHYVVSPYQGFVERAPETVEVAYELGCSNHKRLPVLKPEHLTPLHTADGSGLTLEFFNNLDFSGEPALTTISSEMEVIWFGDMPQEVNPESFSARLSGTFTPSESGNYMFSLISSGLSRFALDGQEIIDNWTAQTPGDYLFGMGSTEVMVEAELTAGQTYPLQIDYCRPQGMSIAAVRIGCLAPIPANALEQAATLAANSDMALLFVGTTGEWESEGFDRPDMDLPGEQVALIEKVAAANKNTVVVLQSGSPIAMPWLNQVAGVLQAWYPGQECGNAIADVLLGTVNPSGKLSQTFPQRLEDNPAFLNYPGENGHVYYGEGIFVGYRYYEKKQIAPLFPFGYGLSYTSFAYDNLRLSAASYDYGAEIQVSLDLTNSGQRAGQEVVQLYVSDLASSLTRPHKELKAFQKVALEAGETQTISFSLDPRALSFYDAKERAWVAEAGEFELLLGSSSADIRVRQTFTLTSSGQSSDARALVVNFDINRSTLQELLEHEGAKSLLIDHLGPMMDSPQLGMALGFSLAQVAGFVPDILTEEKLAEIDTALKALS